MNTILSLCILCVPLQTWAIAIMESSSLPIVVTAEIRDYHDSRFASVSAVRSKFVPGDRSTKRSGTKPPFREVRPQLKSCIRGPFRSAFCSGVCRTPLHDLHTMFTSHLVSHRMCSIHTLHPVVNTCSEHRKNIRNPSKPDKTLRLPWCWIGAETAVERGTSKLEPRIEPTVFFRPGVQAKHA
jgi:hypothetical protein